MTMGTALHLQCGAHRCVIGGRDYRVAANPELEAAQVDCVDGWMWASDFYELLTGIASRSGLDVRGAATGEPTRCWLVSTSTIRGAAYSTLADTFARGIRPSLAIDVGKDAIWVMDPYTNALVASAWLAQVTATPAKRKYMGTSGSGGMSVTLPILVVCVPGVQPLSIGCLDRGVNRPQYSYRSQGQYRFSWRGAAPEDTEPDYCASGADWLTLVAKLGLAPNLAAQRKTLRPLPGRLAGLRRSGQAGYGTRRWCRITNVLGFSKNAAKLGCHKHTRQALAPKCSATHTRYSS
jgi:hypothetical protein